MPWWGWGYLQHKIKCHGKSHWFSWKKLVFQSGPCHQVACGSFPESLQLFGRLPRAKPGAHVSSPKGLRPQKRTNTVVHGAALKLNCGIQCPCFWAPGWLPLKNGFRLAGLADVPQPLRKWMNGMIRIVDGHFIGFNPLLQQEWEWVGHATL